MINSKLQVYHLAANAVIVKQENNLVLYSYSKPVAVYHTKTDILEKTTKFYSITTDKHIESFISKLDLIINSFSFSFSFSFSSSITREVN